MNHRLVNILSSIILIVSPILAEETHVVDHPAMVKGLDTANREGFDRGKALYQIVCINCHGTPSKAGTLPTALRFWEAPMKNGSAPRAMYRTLTKGFNQMVPQNWMTPEQKYQVIHYIREEFLKDANPTQYKKVDDAYLAGIEKETVAGPAPQSRALNKPYLKMDFGQNMNYTFEVGPDNIAYKAIAVRLDKGGDGITKGKAWLAYDHDLMRVAAIWTGDKFCDWRSIGMDGSHGSHPKIVGDKFLVHPKAPGWAKPGTDDFTDPRFLGRDNKPYGPLPRDWTHFKGLYHHGENVVLKYTVGNREVLEMADLAGETPLVVARNLRVGPGKESMLLSLGKGAGDGEVIKGKAKQLIAIVPLAKPKAPEPATQEFDGLVLAASVVGDSEGIAWSSENGHLLLRIPASTEERNIKVLHWRGEASELVAFGKIIDSAKTIDLTPLTKGAAPRWAHDVEVDAKVSESEKPYVVDEIVIPPVTPWNSWMRLSGFDFFKDGKRAAVSTWHGDVWIVSGIGDELGKGKLKWRRIASGLFQPLGVRVIDEVVHLACRDQLVVLRDLNGDGETDYYESLNNDHQVTEHFHEFAMGLQTDEDGNFYYAKSARHARTALVPHHGTLIKVTKDGEKTEIIANGFRAANGVCLNPDGSFFVTDQEGHWTPKNRVNWVTKGGFYGNMMGYTDVKDTSDSAMNQPLAWLTNSFNRSPGELVWTKSKKWGPLEGALLDISYGMGRVFVVLNEKVNGQLQGGEYALPIPDFPTGVMRGRFHPDDGQLYVCGMFAWAGNKRGNGGFYRIRHTGAPACLPTTLEASKGTLRMKFSEKLDKVTATSPSSYKLKTWSIKRTGGYGSRHYDEKPLKVESAKLLADGQTVELNVPDIKPTWCMEINYELKTGEGKAISNRINNTIHNLAKD